MKKNYLILVCLWMMGVLSPSISAQQKTELEEPIMTFYNKGQPGWAFSFSLKFINGSSLDSVYVDFGNGEKLPFYVSDTALHYISSILTHDSLQKEGIIKVYADSATHISYLRAGAQGIKSMDISKCTNLMWLECNDNFFTELDLSFFPHLQFLIAGYNPGITSIDFSQNTKLEYVNIAQIGVKILDVGMLENLLHINVEGTALTSLDLSKNKKLYEILLSSSKIKEFDATQFPNLISLGVSSTNITSLDLTQNPNLFEVYFSKMPEGAFTSIDVSKNPKLVRLFCSQNSITEIDVSNNLKLESLFVSNNKLMNLDVSNNPRLMELSIFSNYFTLATIPPIELGLYFYSPQKPMKVQERIKVGDVLDLSSQLMVSGMRTQYELKKGTKYPYTSLLEGADYTIKNGKITFLRGQTETVICMMKNEIFTGLTMETTPITVDGPIENEENADDCLNIFAKNLQIFVRLNGNAKVEIFDIQGRKIVNETIFGNHGFVVPNAGIYIVKVDMVGKLVNRKIVVL